MRTHFAAAAALALAACACAAHAQMPTFPAPAFRGGNTDWQVVLTTTQSDLSVSYRLSVPEADKAQEGTLGQRNAAYVGCPSSFFRSSSNGIMVSNSGAIGRTIATTRYV